MLSTFNKKTLAVSLALAFTSVATHAIEIDTSTADADLALTLANSLIIPNSGITVVSATYSGASQTNDAPPPCDGEECEAPPCDDDDCDIPFPQESAFSTANFNDVVTASEDLAVQAGLFTNSSGTYGLPSDGGVIFSTGDVNQYGDNPDASISGSTAYGVSASDEQNDLLQNISGRTSHFDPVELNIEFNVGDVDTVSFIAAFGSEEFPNFVGSSFIDAFGIYLNGEQVAGALPTGGMPGDDLLPININHPDFTPVEGTILNGVIAPNDIPLLRFDIPVSPNSTGNTFKFLMADTSDSVLDTTIYLSSFGNFDSDSGESEFTPILPDPSNPTNEDGAFVFDLPEVESGETIWFDPDVAVGYTYTATNGGLFASVSAPTLLTVNDSDGYLVTYIDDMGIEQSFTLVAGETKSFSVPVSTFTLTGINVDLGLDPTDGLAFVTGVSFSQAGQFGVTQAPITVFVPDTTNVSAPGTIALFGLSILALVGFNRRKRH